MRKTSGGKRGVRNNAKVEAIRNSIAQTNYNKAKAAPKVEQDMSWMQNVKTGLE